MLATALYEEPPNFQTRTGFDLRRIVEDQVSSHFKIPWYLGFKYLLIPVHKRGLKVMIKYLNYQN